MKSGNRDVDLDRPERERESLRGANLEAALDGLADVGQRFFLRLALADATREDGHSATIQPASSRSRVTISFMGDSPYPRIADSGRTVGRGGVPPWSGLGGGRPG